jgi:hypothetical protein
MHKKIPPGTGTYNFIPDTFDQVKKAGLAQRRTIEN